MVATLQRDGEGTLLTLVHHGLADGARDAHAEGWSHYLARLAPVAAGLPGEPDPWIISDQKERRCRYRGSGGRHPSRSDQFMKAGRNASAAGCPALGSRTHPPPTGCSRWISVVRAASARARATSPSMSV